jgi:hypothetical protein
MESPVAAATENIHAEVPGGEMRSVEPVAHVAAAAPVEAEVRVEAAPIVVAAQIQAEVQAQVQPQHQAEAVVLAAPLITETPVVATPYTSVASEERVVEFTPPPPQVVAPVAQVAPQPLVLPDGLDQIETDTKKLHHAASKVAAAAPPRPPRVRPALPVISNEPLVQVETGR